MIGIIVKALHTCFVKSNQAPAEKIDTVDAEDDVGRTIRRSFDGVFDY